MLLTGNPRPKDESRLSKAEPASGSSGRAAISTSTGAPCSAQRFPT